MANIIEKDGHKVIYTNDHGELISFRQEDLNKSFHHDINIIPVKISLNEELPKSKTSGNVGYDEFSYEELTTTLINMLQDEVFESGVSTPSEQFVRTYLKQNKHGTMLWLNSVFMKNIRNPHILIGILHMISHFQFKDVYPTGPTIAGFALARKNELEIWDYAIKAFENWGDIECIDTLEMLHITEPWLQDYVNQVIRYLKGL